MTLLEAIVTVSRWTHANLHPPLYGIRQQDYAILRELLAEPIPLDRAAEIEWGFIVRAARVVAGCSDSNRWGAPYYERKDAVMKLRGALCVYFDAKREAPVTGRGPQLRV